MQGKKVAHPNDRSVHTYTGHQVLQTLIRCGFSPRSTGQQYVFLSAVESIDSIDSCSLARPTEKYTFTITKET